MPKNWDRHRAGEFWLENRVCTRLFSGINTVPPWSCRWKGNSLEYPTLNFHLMYSLLHGYPVQGESNPTWIWSRHSPHSLYYSHGSKDTVLPWAFKTPQLTFWTSSVNITQISQNVLKGWLPQWFYNYEIWTSAFINRSIVEVILAEIFEIFEWYWQKEKSELARFECSGQYAIKCLGQVKYSTWGCT